MLSLKKEKKKHFIWGFLNVTNVQRSQTRVLIRAREASEKTTQKLLQKSAVSTVTRHFCKLCVTCGAVHLHGQPQRTCTYNVQPNGEPHPRHNLGPPRQTGNRIPKQRYLPHVSQHPPRPGRKRACKQPAAT